jgi:hypothetical protein
MYEGKGTIKITIEAYGEKYTLEYSDEADMEAMMGIFEKIACLIGYHPDTIKDYLNPDEEKVPD